MDRENNTNRQAADNQRDMPDAPDAGCAPGVNGQPDRTGQSNMYAQPELYGAQNTNAQPNMYTQPNMYGQPNAVPHPNPYGMEQERPAGRIPKNRFGMKLVFSILEIISCNLITCILGIVGCVYTVKANTSHNERKWQEFESHAKASAICLWAGFAAFAAGIVLSVLIWTVGGFGAQFKEIFWQEYYKELREQAGQGPIEMHTVYVDGTDVCIPMEYEDFDRLGFTLAEEDLTQEIEGQSYDFFAVYNEAGEKVMWCWVYNQNGITAMPEECLISGIDVDYDCENYDNYSMESGLGFFNSETDYMGEYGVPLYAEGGEEPMEERRVCWDLGDGGEGDRYLLEITFYDDVIYDIDLSLRSY